MGTHVIVSQLTVDTAGRSGLFEKGHDDMCPLIGYLSAAPLSR